MSPKLPSLDISLQELASPKVDSVEILFRIQLLDWDVQGNPEKPNLSTIGWLMFGSEVVTVIICNRHNYR